MPLLRDTCSILLEVSRWNSDLTVILDTDPASERPQWPSIVAIELRGCAGTPQALADLNAAMATLRSHIGTELCYPARHDNHILFGLDDGDQWVGLTFSDRRDRWENPTGDQQQRRIQRLASRVNELEQIVSGIYLPGTISRLN